MKQGTAKILGVAALGAAFAAAAAGSASAAATTDVLGGLPLKQATKSLPGASESFDAGQSAMSKTKKGLAAMPSEERAPGGLLGGLPAKKPVNSKLPVKNLPLKSVGGGKSGLL
ncbi:ATP-binding protein [Streptomyces sp. NPDC004647]|uniref:ATP-binding protein n=1 Tax=Streptomyces sp. NPDC004647 TaxID=3154671 RepID=UPI0033B76C22